MSTDRKGYYVRPSTGCRIPGVIFAVIVYPRTEMRGPDRRLLVQTWYEASAAVCYRRRGKWSAPQTVRVGTPNALREWMAERARPGRINWVLTPDVGHTLTISEWWTYAESRGVSVASGAGCGADECDVEAPGSHIGISRIVLSGRCGILEYTDDAKRYRWLSARNYWPDGWPVGAVRDRGTDVVGEGGSTASELADTVDGTGSIALLARFRGLCEWWVRVSSAPLGCTAGQLAWGILRSNIQPRTLCAHQHDAAQRLERTCAHGGRASVWYTGQVGFGGHTDGAPHARLTDPVMPRLPGPIYRLDVSSMYPALLRDMPYPCRLATYEVVTPRALRDLVASGVGVIARVTIRTDRGEYPYRAGERTSYPIGEYTTTLAGPDLEELYAHGDVTAVHICATYDMARPFREAMDTLLQDRADAHARMDGDAEALSKLVANSLGGKLAQREGAWERRSKLDEPGRWGEYRILSTRIAKARRLRYLCGACFEYVSEALPRGPHTAAFSYLTAYGRQQMAAVRSACPPRTVVSQDTDGIWALGSALDSLREAGILADVAPGRLRIVGSVGTARFLSARHYCADGVWTLAGISEGKLTEDGRRVMHTASLPLIQHRAHAAPDAVLKMVHCSPLPVDVERGRIQADGWVLPPHIIGSHWQREVG